VIVEISANRRVLQVGLGSYCTAGILGVIELLR